MELNAPASAMRIFLPSVDMKLESVYKKFHGKEPEATNYSYCDFNGPFRGTLDYIFVNNAT